MLVSLLIALGVIWAGGSIAVLAMIFGFWTRTEPGERWFAFLVACLWPGFLAWLVLDLIRDRRRCR